MIQSFQASLYEGHVWLPLNLRIILGLGALWALKRDLRRADMVGILNEMITLPCIMKRLHEKMLSNATGRRLLRERPRMNTKILNLDKLHSLPEHTLGKTYAIWMDTYRLNADTRGTVRYINHMEWAYIIQRYRESHDFYHTLTGLPATIEGEVALKWFEWVHLGLPAAMLSGLLGIFRLNDKQRQRLYTLYIPWALYYGRNCQMLLNVYWEEELTTNIEVLRQRLGLRVAPRRNIN
ncbi:hypothetical protein PCANB_002228 [Pneumocystis canis]|nr:hypothetical protein PCANB_002228 [Pneumocystis canis]